MPDRVVRDELLQSDRWLDLPTDTHRLAYVALILVADDYGNLKGGPRRMFRWLLSFTQIKAEPDAIKLLSDLHDADLIGRYEVDGIEFWHVHRFKNSRKYWSRKWPRSPFAENNKVPTKEHPTENPDPILTPPSPQLPGGVGVGEELKEAPQAAHDSIWSDGLRIVMNSGVTESNARSFIGTLCAQWDDSHVLDALRTAVGKAEPKAYARKFLESRPKKGQALHKKVAV